MDFAVLVKVVPALDDLRYDPARRTVVREGTEMFLNPFDQRALRVALDLRRPGERVAALSLGPPSALGPLRDAPALGVDRTILISDPRLAGSDTLATARVLARALGRVGHDVILGGAWTTDSETGQVGPEVAALLGVPVLTLARAIERDALGVGLAVTVDTADGWAHYRATAPLLVTVGEKITKPSKVAPEARERVRENAIEVVSLDALALPAERVGAVGSPTMVRWVVEDAPRRSPIVIAEGSPSERVDRAVAVLRGRLAEQSSPPREPPVPPRELRDDREVLVLVTDRDGALHPASDAVVAEVGRSLPGYWSSAVWLGSRPGAAETARLSHAGVGSGYHVPLPRTPTDSGTAALAFGRVLDHRPRAAAGVLVSDPFGRETAGQLAAARSLGLTGDAIGVRVEAPDTLVWTKPSFGGRSIAGISSRTVPSLATVRPGGWEAGPGAGLHDAFEWTELAPVPARPAPTLESSGREVEAGTTSLDQPEVVVAVGMGVGGPEGIRALTPLIARWGATLGATRKVVDSGWLPRQLQIGLTGRSPAPRLGVLLGVGGATNHLVGWKRAKALLAVNRDPGAPVFRDVDVGIVGTIEEIVPRLGDALAPLLGR